MQTNVYSDSSIDLETKISRGLASDETDTETVSYPIVGEAALSERQDQLVLFWFVTTGVATISDNFAVGERF